MAPCDSAFRAPPVRSVPVTDTARLLDPFRLPRDARPTRYDVTLEPDLTAAVFTGEVVIHLVVDETDDDMFADRIGHGKRMRRDRAKNKLGHGNAIMANTQAAGCFRNSEYRRPSCACGGMIGQRAGHAA